MSNYVGPDAVLLTDLDAKASSPAVSFAPDHAEKLLAYPGTRWAKAEETTAKKPHAAEAAPAADSPAKPKGSK